MADIFISYAREDMEFVRALSKAFEDRNYSVWVDLAGLIPGEHYWPRIRQAITEAGTFLFVISPDSAESVFCRREIDRAVELQKRIVPVLRRDVSTDALCEPIAIRQWQILRESEDFAREIDTLIKAIAIDPAWVRAHTHWLTKASQWDDNGRDSDRLLRGNEMREAEDWLAQATQHPEPQPTQLQIDYITTSRKVESERQRQKRSLAFAVSSICIVLAALALYQGWKANQQRRHALARQLTAQAEALRTQRPEWHLLSTRLAIEAVRLFPTAEIAQALHRGSPLVPCATYRAGAPMAALSPNGRVLISAGYDCTVRLGEVDNPQAAIRLKHQAVITSVSFSGDGQYLATVSQDGAACLWRAASGKQLFCLSSERKITAVTFSSDSKYIAAASQQNVAWIWEMARCQSVDCPPTATLTHEGGVSAIAFSPDDRVLVTASWDNKARLWNVSRCLEIRCEPSTVLPHDNGVLIAAFSPDSKYLVTVGYDPLIRVWDVASCSLTDCQPLAPFIRHDSMVTAVAFSPDGKSLASAGWDRTARIWSLPTGKPLARFFHNHGVSAVAFSKDGAYLATGSYDRRACVWTIATEQQVSCSVHDTAVTEVSFRPHDQQVITASYDSAVRLWDPFRHSVTERVHATPLTLVTTSANGEYVATVSRSVTGTQPTDIALWQKNQQLLAHFPYHADVAQLAFSPDGQYLALASWDNTAELWQLKGGQKQVLAQVSHDSEVTTLAVSPNGKYLAIGGWRGTVSVWDVARCHYDSCQPMSLPTGPNLGITALAFSPDSKWLVTAGWNNSAQMWDLTRDSPQLHTVANHMTTVCPDGEVATQSSGIAAVTFGSTGQFFATASYDHTARVWNLKGEQQVCISDASGVTAIAFDAVDKHLATATWDKTVHVWEIPGRREATRLRTEEGVTALTFSANKLLTTGWDQVIQQWTWERDVSVTEACDGLQGRMLSKAEWERYFGTEEPYRATCTRDWDNSAHDSARGGD